MALVHGGAHGPSVGLAPLTADQAVADLQTHATSDHPQFPSGWSIDDRCGMVSQGELVLVWARSSAGKSTMMLNMVNNVPEVPTMVVNMEMSARRQVEWLAAMSLGLDVPAQDIFRVLREGPDDLRESVEWDLARMGDKFPHLWFVNPSMPTVTDLEDAYEDITDTFGVPPQRIFIDHVGKMGGADDYTSYNRIIGGLHDFAMRSNTVVYAIQQTGRGGGGDGVRNDGHVPVTLSSGVYTGEQHADWVWGLFRPERDPRLNPVKLDQLRAAGKTEEWMELMAQRDAVRNRVWLQVIKNRPHSDLCEEGVELAYDPHTRQLREAGEE